MFNQKTCVIQTPPISKKSQSLGLALSSLLGDILWAF